MKDYYLYLYLVDDKVVYVGQTCDPWGRYKQHLGEKDNKQKYSEVNKIMLYGFNSRADVDIYETYFIATLKPELNKSKTDFETPSIRLDDLCFEEHSISSLEKYFKKSSKHKRMYKAREEIEKFYIFSNTQAMLIHNQHIKNDLEVKLESEIDNLKSQIKALESHLDALKESSKKIENEMKDNNNENSYSITNFVRTYRAIDQLNSLYNEEEIIEKYGNGDKSGVRQAYINYLEQKYALTVNPASMSRTMKIRRLFDKEVVELIFQGKLPIRKANELVCIYEKINVQELINGIGKADFNIDAFIRKYKTPQKTEVNRNY